MLALICLFLVILSAADVNGRTLHRIVGGNEAKQCEFPHIALVYIKKSTGKFGCGGSLIDESHVITAAHCVSGDVQMLYVLFGSLKTRKMNNIIKISNYSQHESYGKFKDTVLNDVALLTLSHPVIFSDCLKPIRLAAADEKFVGNCTIAGWGKTGSNLSKSEQLLRADVPLMTHDNCIQHTSNLKEQHLCAGDASFNGKSTCLGDSGGPLMCTSASDGSIVLAGITSYGWSCTEGVSVFAKISYFIDWIKRHTK